MQLFRGAEREGGRARDICVFSCIPIMVLICVQKQSNHCSFCEMFNNSITDTQVSCTLFTFHVRSVSLCISQFRFSSRSLTCSISNIEQPTTQIEHLTICTDILSIYDFGGLFFSYSLGVCVCVFLCVSILLLFRCKTFFRSNEEAKSTLSPQVLFFSHLQILAKNLRTTMMFTHHFKHNKLQPPQKVDRSNKHTKIECLTCIYRSIK